MANLNLDIPVRFDVTREMAERALAIVQWYCDDNGASVETRDGKLVLENAPRAIGCMGTCDRYFMGCGDFWDRYGNLPGRCPGFKPIEKGE